MEDTENTNASRADIVPDFIDCCVIQGPIKIHVLAHRKCKFNKALRKKYNMCDIV